MNTKILASLVLIGIAISGITFGTVAYFSDTETSTGNTFTAGKLDLLVDSKCKYNGVTQGFCTWDLMNIDGNNKLFFNFNDVKPGDNGEDTVSLHVYDNPACGFVHYTKTSDLDNTCNEPELVAETDCATDPDGELDDNMQFTIWMDTNCDNIKDTNEPILYTGSLITNKDLAIGELAIGAAQDTCVGISWNLPSAVGNIVQSDSFAGTLQFEAQQKRHQYATCPVGELHSMNFGPGGWAGWSCPAGTHVISGGNDCALPVSISQAAKPGVPPYPVYPHYIYHDGWVPPEEGWVVQNGATGQTCNVYVLCL